MEKHTYLVFDKEMSEPVRKETSVGVKLVSKLQTFFDNSDIDIEFSGPQINKGGGFCYAHFGVR
jgi:hypothetical protein